jgi:hypothetical protein
LFLDADRIIRHREPEVRIRIGTQHPGDQTAAWIAELLTGRGLIAQTCEDIAQHVWTRSIFLAAGVGASLWKEMPLRDALRTVSGDLEFRYMCVDGRDIAERSGVTVTKDMIHAYRQAMYLDGEAVQPPPRITDPDSAGDEALFLLAQMVGRSLRCRAKAPDLKRALAMATETRRATTDAA